MKINEVFSGLETFTARVRVGVMTCVVSIQCDGAVQARLLLAKCYGSDNVLQIIRQTVNERVLKSIKPLTPAQLSKKASSDLKKSMAQKIKKDKAQRKVRNAQADLAVINRQPA